MHQFAAIVAAHLTGSTRRIAGLVVGLSVLVLAIGHLFALERVSGMWYGVPTWLWFQLLVVALMLAMAWIAVGLWRTDTRGERPR